MIFKPLYAPSMRIARGSQLIGEWSAGQIKIRLADATLLDTDLYYDEEASDWMPLSNLSVLKKAPVAVKQSGRVCYCGSGLSFFVCHGDGSKY